MRSGRKLQPGTRVRVRQTISGREEQWTSEVEGEVLSHEMEKTGAWFAHSQDHKLWLDRLRLKKDDGEITVLNLDGRTEITIL